MAVALRDIAKNTEVEAAGQCFVALDDIPMGHKMALRDLRAGENVRKYGSPIGHVTQDVPAGSWLHSHNVRTNLEGLLDYQYHPALPAAASEHALPDTFLGYLRPDGRA
ncbi:MAG: UxaA family hydrolase, partial [Oscillospiraceae bacterium]|nr:UxaA family hydrolase [Oscillospiraceae bacterium]